MLIFSPVFSRTTSLQSRVAPSRNRSHRNSPTSRYTALEERGVDFTRPRLCVVDDAKALGKALQQHAGESALIQRCQLPKRRNAASHLAAEYRATIDRQLTNACAMTATADAKRALEKLPRELRELHPSAARPLAAGREDALTVHRLPLPHLLRRTFATTNPIEPAFSGGRRLVDGGGKLP